MLVKLIDEYLQHRPKDERPKHCFHPSSLSRRFRVPLLILLHLIVRAGIADAKNYKFARLLRVGILHLSFGIFLALAEEPSCVVVSSTTCDALISQILASPDHPGNLWQIVSNF